MESMSPSSFACVPGKVSPVARSRTFASSMCLPAATSRMKWSYATLICSVRIACSAGRRRPQWAAYVFVLPLREDEPVEPDLLVQLFHVRDLQDDPYATDVRVGLGEDL